MVVFENVSKEEVAKLKGFVMEAPKGMYEDLRFSKNGVAVVLYTSGKLFLQGKKEKVDKVADQIRRLHIGDEVRPTAFRREGGWIIGSDETLKGDTFGGLVVAAVKADKIIREKLIDLGVADSKKLSDKEVQLMADKIKRIAQSEIRSIFPEEYNKSGKVTIMLNKLHEEVARELLPGKHVVDKYPGCNVGDIMETKAESKYVEVAAASVLARSVGLKQLEFLSNEVGFPLPKGSTHVKEALQRLREKGLDFKKLVKVDFNNVKEFL